MDRAQNLPALKKVQITRSRTPLGNCAEDETLAHLDGFIKAVRGRSPPSSILAVTSTVNLLDGTPVSNCGQCRTLLYQLRADYRHVPLKTLDLMFE